MFRIKFREESRFTLDFHGSDTIKLKFNNTNINISPDYEGPYRVEPSVDSQVLETRGKCMKENVIIEPIPSNYGLVTWNGSYLTVS